MKLDRVRTSTSLDDVPARARDADEIAFDGLWTAEPSHDPYLPLPLVAEHGARIEFGTSIAVALPRSPLVALYLPFQPGADVERWRRLVRAFA